MKEAGVQNRRARNSLKNADGSNLHKKLLRNIFKPAQAGLLYSFYRALVIRGFADDLLLCVVALKGESPEHRHY